MEADVIVVGGGSAGTAAAVSSARRGASTVLVERYGYLGGMSTAGMVGTFCGFFTGGHDGPTPVVGGFADEVLAGLRRRGGLGEVEPLAGKTHVVAYDLESLKSVADDLVTDAGVQLALNCRVTDVIVEDELISSIIVETKQGPQAFNAPVVIDASGDADVAWRAGAETQLGKDGFIQLPSMMFKMANVEDSAKAFSTSDLQTRMRAGAENGAYELPRLSGSYRFTSRPGEVRCNMTRVDVAGGCVDPTDWVALTAAEQEGRRQVEEYSRFLRAEVPGFEDSFVSHVGAQLGVRESRRVVGDHLLTAEELLGCAQFEDSIGRNAWPMEIHHQGEGTEWRWLPDGGHHEIPMRSLVVAGLKNLLVVGRCASATHEAMASLRVIGPCYAMGQAAGTAAAMASEAGVPVRSLQTTGLQAALLADGALI